MQKISLILALSFAIFSQAFAADDCAPVDTRDSLPADVKAFITTPSDQGDTGWCFGYAAADLVSQAVGTPVSALHLSAYYSSQVGFWGKLGRVFTGDTGTTPQGGFIPTAIHEISDLGYACKESDLSSVGTHDVWITSKTKTQRGMATLIYNLKLYRENKCDAICTKTIDTLVQAFFPATSPVTVKNYLVKNPRVKLEDAIFYFADATCRYKSIPLNSARLEYKTYLKPARIGGNILGAINEALNRRRFVGMEYDAAYITDAGGFMGQSHASTIVARKRINNQCYYLVRNSWGENCDYRPSIICEKKQGSYWVPATTVERMIVRATWIE